MKRTFKKILGLIAAATLLMAVPAAAQAAENSYEPTDSYVIYYGQKVGDKNIIEHPSPFTTNLSYEYASDPSYDEFTSVMSLYSTYNNSLCLPVYCVDEYTGVVKDTYYKRINLEDSTYFSDETAAKLRSITLKGFPCTSVDSLAAAAGIEGLTQGEAVHATQLAIWSTAYGGVFTINEQISSITDYWTTRGYPSVIHYYDPYKAELETLQAASEEELVQVEARVQAAYDYLMNLAPTALEQKAVSSSSFVDWSSEPELSKNADGTYDVTVSATVNVQMSGSDELVLTAVLGDKHVSKDLVSGSQTVKLTIPGASASEAKEKVVLNIDGAQTASDVYMYVPAKGREQAQQMIGYSNVQQPVHAEVTVEPERVVNITKLAMGGTAPLEGIHFDFYFIADRSEYLSGKADVPKNPSDCAYSGYGDYTAVTDSNGKATFNLTKSHMPDGVYLVVERAHPAIVAPVKPFYVILPATSADGSELEYVVDVKPKNEVYNDVSIDKDVISLGTNEASVDAAAVHTWIISASIPRDLALGKSYAISDTLDNRLDFMGNVKVRVENADGTEVKAELAEDVDYTLASEGNSFSVSLTASGMAKVANAAGTDYAGHKVRVYFDAQINENAALAEKIPNSAVLDYTNSVGFNFDAESDKPVVSTGGARLLKVDAQDHETVLKGAKFQLYRPATAAELNDDSVEKVFLEGMETSMVQVEFFDSESLSGNKTDTAVSGEDGKVHIYGLAYGTYYLVETKAPAGYNLLGAPAEMVIDSGTHLVENVMVVENEAGVALPETGGEGTTMLYVVGALLAIGAAVALVVKRRMAASK